MNRLADSLSPYLLQHRGNPVDWYPWCDEAFEEARRTDRPVFLSVGYAACHWCHVMERESFENEEIAAVLNREFVSIKVDREERPDVDQVYMVAVQLMTGHGGWPMSVFLTHDRQPFYAGTYWPAEPRGGMPSFPQVLEAIADAWKRRREEVESHAAEIAGSLIELAEGSPSAAAPKPDPPDQERPDQERPDDPPPPDDPLPGDELIRDATDRLLRALDRRDGGFGSPPKFPHATDLDLLIRRGVTEDDEAAVQAAAFTLDKMAAGGIRDHIGGGFARYSVDAKWLVPHFEKMLYDNALLGELYVRGFQATGNPRHAEVAAETFDYLCREMVDPSGGLHCSEDADSEGVEGKYYVWTPEEVAEVLGESRGERFSAIYDITPRGNFEGKSIPNLPIDLADWADRLSVPETRLRDELAEDRERLRQARERRVRPGRDDKLITAWNALAVRALAVGGGVLDRPDYLQVATAAAEFIHTTMRRPDGVLLHAFRDGTAHLVGYLDDYAYTIDAYVTLFEATGKARWIGRACDLADTMLQKFRDPERGGFFYTAEDGERLIVRGKDWHDGSLVSGNAAAAMGLIRLAQVCLRDDYRRAAESTLRAGAEVMRTQAAASAGLLAALDRFLHDEGQAVVAVVDERQLADVRPQRLRHDRPRVARSWVIGEPPERGPVATLNAGKPAVDGKPTLYLCRDHTCEPPVVDPDFGGV